MAVTYGFYASLNGDRKYSAEQFSSLFNGIINDGVFMNIGDHFEVKVSSGMGITVGTGRAWFNSTWTNNDTLLPLTVDSRDVLDRIDAVVLEVNTAQNTRANTIKIVKGTASSSPVCPDMENTTTVHQHCLAEIYVKANTGSTVALTAADITNKVGSTVCPYITGILAIATNDAIVSKWESEFDQWMASEQSGFTSWEANQKANFDTWFNTLQVTLDGNVAAKLEAQILNIQPNGETIVV